MIRHIYKEEFLKICEGIEYEYLFMCSEFFKKKNRYTRIGNSVEVNILLKYLLSQGEKFCQHIDSKFLRKFLDYVDALYIGKKERGNLRFIVFTFSRKNIDEFFRHIQATMVLEKLDSVFEVFKRIGQQEGFVILDKEKFLGKGETRSKRLQLITNFIGVSSKIDLEDYFNYFFKDFMNSMIEKDPSTTPGFWFSMSVVNSYIGSKRCGKRGGNRIRVIEEGYR